MKNLTQLVIVMLLFGTVANAQIRRGIKTNRKITTVKKPPLMVKDPLSIIVTPKTGKNYMIHSLANRMFYLTTVGDIAGHKQDLVVHNIQSESLLNFVWKVQDASNNKFWLEPYTNQLVRTDVSGGVRSRIYTYRKHNKTNQQFSFVSYPNQAYHAIQRVMSPNVVLEVKGSLPDLPIGNNSPGIPVWAGNLANTQNQKFKFEEVHVGAMRISEVTNILNNRIFNRMQMRIDNFNDRYASNGTNNDVYNNTSSITLLSSRINIHAELAREQFANYFNYRMINDMNLSNAEVVYQNQKWILRLQFEENGKEIKKLCYPNCNTRLSEYDIRNNKWEMEIRPVIKNGKFTFEVYNITSSATVADSSGRSVVEENGLLRNKVNKYILNAVNKALKTQKNAINLMFLRHMRSAGIKRNAQFTTAKNGNIYFIEKR